MKPSNRRISSSMQSLSAPLAVRHTLGPHNMPLLQRCQSPGDFSPGPNLGAHQLELQGGKSLERINRRRDDETWQNPDMGSSDVAPDSPCCSCSTQRTSTDYPARQIGKGAGREVGGSIRRSFPLEYPKVPEGEIDYYYNRVDLDGDGEPEVLVYLFGPHVCGTGGCGALVFKSTRGGYRIVGNIVLARNPIIVSEHKTH